MRHKQMHLYMTIIQEGHVSPAVARCVVNKVKRRGVWKCKYMNQTHWAEFTLLINLGTASSKSERKNEATSAMQQSYQTSSCKAPRLLSLSVCVASLLCRSCTASGFSRLRLSRSLHTSAPSRCLTDNWGHSQSSYSVQVVCSQKISLKMEPKKG